jgi:putative ABC transport system permease protein
MRRSLIYFWRMNLAVALGAATTTAVLTGALIVGDSMRGSLRQLTLERLGGIDYALASHRFFREDLGNAISENLRFQSSFTAVAPAIVFEGSAGHPDSGARARNVRVYGIDDRFTGVFGASEADLLEFEPSGVHAPFPPVVINEALQAELAAQVGDAVLISFPQPNEVHSEYLLGSRDPANQTQALRLTVAGVLPNRGLGRLALEPNQSLPFNAYLPLSRLQQSTDRRGRANSLFVSGTPTASDRLLLQEILGQSMHLADLDLVVRSASNHFAVESREMVIPPAVEEAALQTAESLGAPVQRVLTHLANTIRSGERTIPYSIVTSLEFPPAAEWGFEGVDGRRIGSLEGDEIILNDWAAGDLEARLGDAVDLTYFVLGPLERLDTETRRFRLAGIATMTGLGADHTLTPEIPGISDADSVAGWDPPVPIDLRRIRPRDEEYWDRFRAAPKAFIAYRTGLDLWETRFGRVTSIRIGPGEGLDLESTREQFESTLLRRFPPARLGLSFQPVKERGLGAAAGTTDFGVLFLGFSFFLIVSAALLVGLLFRLGVERRARQIGLLLSVGYPLRSVRRRFLLEGIAIAGGGGILGLAAAVAYARLMVHGLQTWWADAVGPVFLSVHLHAATLAVGYLLSLAVVVISIGWAVRRLAKVPTPLLLAGSTEDSGPAAPRGWVKATAYGFSATAIALLTVALLVEETASVGLFFGVGIGVLVSGLAFFALWMRSFRRSPIRPGGFASSVRMAARSSARHPGRSLLSAALVASACFVIVAVGANRREPVEELLGRESGAGGFALLAQSDIPIHQDLNDAEGRFELGFPDGDSDRLKGVEIIPLRLRPGEDVSCLNLYQPQSPRILGAPDELIRRGGFRFQGTLEAGENPWALLERDLGPGLVPAFADANSARWVLHLGLGDDLAMENERGEEIRLRLVGLFDGSIFQSELMVSETNFLHLFPGRSGYSYFLVDAPAGEKDEIAGLLEVALSDFGFDATPTTRVLSAYLAVENTYLSTFQTLGGLGLLLGTLGLGVVLVRSVLERRAELAALRAFGYRRSKLARMVVAESGFLLLLGMALGTVSAIVAVVPQVADAAAPFPWVGLALTLLAVLVVGLGAGVAAVVMALRIPLLPALRAE